MLTGWGLLCRDGGKQRGTKRMTLWTDWCPGCGLLATGIFRDYPRSFSFVLTVSTWLGSSPVTSHRAPVWDV